MASRPIYPWTEYLRPWKLSTLAAGIALLLIGAQMEIAPDWDVPISFIMALLAYLTAPWSLRVLLDRHWRLLPLALLATWFTVDGCYAIYWHYRNPAALALMRAWNFPASLSLYGLCGVLWLYRGSLRELSNAIAGVRPGDRGDGATERAAKEKPGARPGPSWRARTGVARTPTSIDRCRFDAARVNDFQRSCIRRFTFE